MADTSTSSTDSTIFTNDEPIQMCQSETPPTGEKKFVSLSTNINRHKRKLTPEEYRQRADKLLEIEQIKCEEYLVQQEINRVNIQRQHIKNLINQLHMLDYSNKIIKNSRSRLRRLR
ncbi:unnamed protein product [Adineta steineri]|uniref:Uncharacterized protein n=1 Tax=Adineta steineri TaxID=433720 RepID=A0A813XAM1_9BILA|nr:unnamed protein product [Adineta steineri]